jgi:hypothetical protein
MWITLIYKFINMKKLIVSTLVLCGALSFAQSTPLMIHNYSKLSLEGRLMACSRINPGGYPVAFAAPNLPYGVYTVPPLTTDVEYVTLNTSVASLLPILKWYVTTAGGTTAYNYNDPSMAGISSSVEWAMYHFVTKDDQGNGVDTFTMGNPIVSNMAGFSTNLYQLGTTAEAEWFSISGMVYLQVYDY